MSRKTSVLLVLVLLATSLVAAAPAAAAPSAPSALPVPGPCQVLLPNEWGGAAKIMVCVPEQGWNDDLVVFAHGYTSPSLAPDFQNLSFGGQDLPELVQELGFAFATSSYSQTGLIVAEPGQSDILALTAYFRQRYPATERVYLTGASEGGILAALLAEKHPDVFSGALSACGPVGSFQRQVDYLGDFRVLFDFFFAPTPQSALYIPTNPISIDEGAVWPNWETAYVPALQQAVAANPKAARHLLATAGAPGELSAADPYFATIRDVLWYSAFATNDAAVRVNGNAFNNLNPFRRYIDPLDLIVTARLNTPYPRGAWRTAANPPSRAAVAANYDTSGHLSIPVITLHTTGDPVIPFWHQTLYRAKVRSAGSLGQLTQIPVFRYGHCNFSAAEVLAAFGLLVWDVTGMQPEGLIMEWSPEQVQQDYLRASRMREAVAD